MYKGMTWLLYLQLFVYPFPVCLDLICYGLRQCEKDNVEGCVMVSYVPGLVSYVSLMYFVNVEYPAVWGVMWCD